MAPWLLISSHILSVHRHRLFSGQFCEFYFKQILLCFIFFPCVLWTFRNKLVWYHSLFFFFFLEMASLEGSGPQTQCFQAGLESLVGVLVEGEREISIGTGNLASYTWHHSQTTTISIRFLHTEQFSTIVALSILHCYWEDNGQTRFRKVKCWHGSKCKALWHSSCSLLTVNKETSTFTVISDITENAPYTLF